MAKKSRAKKAAVKKVRAKKATAKKTAQRSQGLSLRAGDPIAPFMCFRTADDNVFIKFDWNPAARKYNLNRRIATRSECQE